MLDLFNIPSKTKADVQFFYQDAVWTKPRGASFIYMLLIGGGGNGVAGTSGGGSGAITRWVGSAINTPDNLVIHPSTGNADNTTVSYRGTTLTTLLIANAASGGSFGASTTGTPFASTGFYQNNGGSAGSGGLPATTVNNFLMPGGTNNATVTGNYGYTATTGSESYFMTQPIIHGCGISSTSRKDGAIGCGGSRNASSLGGPGLVIIASW